MITFNKPYITGKELDVLKKAISERDISGNGVYTKKCEKFLSSFLHSNHILLTSSCTHALEMAALLCDIQPGDEVIIPSFTFVSCANAFVLRGARIVFVDIRPDTMNINENLIESAITKKTKVILVMHYGGVACEMESIMSIAKNYDLLVVEDAAHCIDAYVEEKHLGTIGHLGTLSFHSTKNVHCGEGGALIINDERFANQAEVLREKGTNRKAFIRKEVDRYSWIDVGSSYLMSDLSAAFLFAQLNSVKAVSKSRMMLWETYNRRINEYFINKMNLSSYKHNGHIFYIKLTDASERFRMIEHLERKKIGSAFHYIPLHTSKAGQKFGHFHGSDRYTTVESEKLLRLPIYPDLSNIERIIEAVNSFDLKYASKKD